MQSIMVSLMDSAAGKCDFTPPDRTPLLHPESFIISGEYRRECSSVTSNGTQQDTPQEDTSSTEDVSMYSPSETDYPSYIPCYDVTGYSSQPTYIRGDFYNLSPPESPSCQTDCTSDSISHFDENTHQLNGNRTFTIDSLIAPESTKSEQDCDDNPAKVFSAFTSPAISCSSGQFRFSPPDWSIFQPPTRMTAAERTTCRKAFWCHACDEYCLSTTSASQHQDEHFRKGDNCKLLRKFFSIHGYITSHEETEYLNRIKCGLCGKIVTNCFFSKHLRRHDGHVCDVCGHECTTSGRLQAHMNGHTGNRPYACKVCNRKFGDKSQMNNHMQTHREGNHQCRFCAKVFRSKQGNLVHERIHTGNNPYVCDVPGCDRSFPQKIQLKLHETSHQVQGST